NTFNGYWNRPSGGKGGTFSITLAEKPKITKGPKIHMKDNNLVLIYWETSRPTNSLVEYGKSPSAYENDSDPLYLNNYVTEHWVEVPNIEYHQTYYYTITSADRYGNQVESGEEYNFKFIASSSVDGYDFKNWAMINEDWVQIYESINPIRVKYFEPMNFNPIFNIYKAGVRASTPFGGHCYGMASTSILFFENAIKRPMGDERTIDIEKEDAREDIERYQANQLTGEKMMGVIYNFIIRNNPEFDGEQEFNNIVQSIDKDTPLLINLNGAKLLSKEPKIELKKVTHAVTPIGYSFRDKSGIIDIYDNNIPYQTHEIKITKNSIEYMDDLYELRNIEFSSLTSMEPEKDISTNYLQNLKFFSDNLKSELGGIESYILSLMCPADLRIVDQYGRVITTLNGESNEIPDAILNAGEEFEIYNLPSNLEYTIELIGTDDGNAELSFASKDIILTFNDIQITPLTRGKMYIGKTNSYILSLDNNNDGIIDEYLTPMIDTYTENGYNITFLPPITTMASFSLKDGSTLPIKFTVRNSSTDEFTYGTTVNVTIKNSTGNVIAYFTNGTGANSVRINSIDKQYAVDFNTMDYPELTIGETYAIQVTFGDVSSLRGYAIAYFTLVDRTPPPSITNPHPTAGTTHINWTWTNPPDPDFNHTEIYLNGAFQTVTSAEHFNATDLTPETSYTISTRTVDTAGNISQTWVNDTDTTLTSLLPPSAASSTATGATKDAYRTNEDVYATGSGFTTANADIYLVQDQDWNDGDPIPADVTGSVETVSVSDGDIAPVLVWHAPLTPGRYDIVIDVNRNGVYDAHADGLDRGSPGFVVIISPPPTPPTNVPALTPHGIIALIGLLCVIGTIMIRRRFN
ncbi:MAG: hypothetical protein KAR25_01200, partial [Methanosarcinales archaeon]|nr:hypothetical protein [Methanosarcinales archaeon]